MEISYDERNGDETFGNETFVYPPETKFRYRNVKNASKVSYTNGEFRIRNEDFVYEMKAWDENFVSKMLYESFANELSYRGGGTI